MHNFINALGTFWTHLFNDKDLLNDMGVGYELSLSNAYFEFMELILGASVADIPIFNRHNWYHLHIAQGDDGVDVANKIRYGEDDLYYGDGSLYGSTRPGYAFSVALSTDIIEISEFICNGIYAPSVVLVKNQDFIFENGALFFVENPLGTLQEASFWIPLVQFDKEYLWRKYGGITGIYRDHSSEEYKQLLKSAFAIFYNGPRKRYIMGYLNSIYSLPTILDAVETVTDIEEDADLNITITTDKHIYHLPTAVTPIASIVVGTTLKQFSPLTSAVTYIDHETDPSWWKSGSYFMFPKKLLGAGYNSSLQIYNQFVVYENILGTVKPIAVNGSFDATIEYLFKNFPLTLGMPIILGEPYTYLNTIDYFASQIQDNFFVVDVNHLVADLSHDDTEFWNIFERIMPVDLSYIVRYNITTDTDTYTSDDITDTIELLEGVTPLDTWKISVEIRDGFWGALQLGNEIILNGTYVLGQTIMHRQPYIQVLDRSET